MFLFVAENVSWLVATSPLILHLKKTIFCKTNEESSYKVFQIKNIDFLCNETKERLLSSTKN